MYVSVLGQQYAMRCILGKYRGAAGANASVWIQYTVRDSVANTRAVQPIPRTEVPYSDAAWTFDAQGDCTNANVIATGDATSAVTAPTHAEFFTAAVGGDYLGHALMMGPADDEELPDIGVGDNYKFQAGAIRLLLDQAPSSIA